MLKAVANLGLWGLQASSNFGAPASTGLMYLIWRNDILHTRDEQKSLSFFHATVNYLFTLEFPVGHSRGLDRALWSIFGVFVTHTPAKIKKHTKE